MAPLNQVEHHQGVHGVLINSTNITAGHVSQNGHDDAGLSSSGVRIKFALE